MPGFPIEGHIIDTSPESWGVGTKLIAFLLSGTQKVALSLDSIHVNMAAMVLGVCEELSNDKQ